MTKRVLIIEGDDDLRELMVACLGDAGYAVRACRSHADALARLAEDRVELVVADTESRAPASAWTGVLALRAAAGPTPILLTTGHGFDASDVRAAGFAGLLPKPFDLDALEARVRTTLAQS
jgi:DNA-binding response OmpR family regulator